MIVRCGPNRLLRSQSSLDMFWVLHMVVFGRSWGLLGPLGVALGASWGALGPLGRFLADLEATKTTFKKMKENESEHGGTVIVFEVFFGSQNRPQTLTTIDLERPGFRSCDRMVPR